MKIILIGVKDNHGLQKTIPAFGEDGEKKCIEEFFKIIRELKPTIIGGYNSAFFDWPFILKRAEIRRQIPTRKSVIEGKPDRIADLLEEAANEIIKLRVKF